MRKCPVEGVLILRVQSGIRAGLTVHALGFEWLFRFAKPRQIASPMRDAAQRITPPMTAASGILSSRMVGHLSVQYASLSQKVRWISSVPGAEWLQHRGVRLSAKSFHLSERRWFGTVWSMAFAAYGPLRRFAVAEVVAAAAGKSSAREGCAKNNLREGHRRRIGPGDVQIPRNTKASSLDLITNRISEPDSNSFR